MAVVSAFARTADLWRKPIVDAKRESQHCSTRAVQGRMTEAAIGVERTSSSREPLYSRPGSPSCRDPCRRLQQQISVSSLIAAKEFARCDAAVTECGGANTGGSRIAGHAVP